MKTYTNKQTNETQDKNKEFLFLKVSAPKIICEQYCQKISYIIR